MSDQTLSLTLAVVADQTTVKLGEGNKGSNRITIRITNDSDRAVSFGSAFGNHGACTLSFSVGSDPGDLVHGLDESTGLTVDAPQDWKPQPYRKKDNLAIYGFWLPKQVCGPKEGKTITLQGFDCLSVPGKARLGLALDITGYVSFAQTLEVEKRAETFELLYVKANPSYVTTEQERQGFTLSWSTVQAGTVVLKKNQQRLASFIAGQKGFDNGTEFSYREEHPDLGTTIYELTAWDSKDARSSRTIERPVNVLQPGWHAVEFRRYGYPAVLCSLDDEDLYGIFIDHGRARLCSSKHPIAVWNLENDLVPNGMSTSPAVGFDSRVWVLGGSSVDTEGCSNRIWSYDPAKAQWQEAPTPPWCSRMGHACVIFDGRLWVIGGMDEDGNALRDLYSMDKQGSWQAHADAPWDPRCMLAATVYQRRLWIYGGLAEPFGDPRTDMWTFSEATGWVAHTALPSLPNDSLGQPISNTLQVVGGQLYLLGSFRSGQTVRARQCVWNEAQRSWFVQEVTSPWDQQGQNTHSLSGAVYHGLLFLRSLNWSTAENPTKLYMLKP